MKKRNSTLSGVMKKQSRLAKLLFDLERKNKDGSFLLSGAARERVEHLVEVLEQQVVLQ